MNLAKPIKANRASVPRSHFTIACPNCGIYQPLEADYDGGPECAILAITPCGVCQRELCIFCEQAKCECGTVVCGECTVNVPDGPCSQITLCKTCANSSDPLCPTCGAFARMMQRHDSQQQWFECSACGAAMEADEIEAVQPFPARRREMAIAREQQRGRTFPEVA